MPCDPADPAFICGLSDPEDLVRLPGTDWIVISSLNIDIQSGYPPKVAGPGPLQAIRIDTRKVHALYPAPDGTVDWDRKAYPHCPGPPQSLTTHGLNIRSLGGARFRVYATNHGGRQSVEVVDVAVQGDRLRATWRGCIPVTDDLGIWPNSLAPLADGGIILSGDNVATWRPGGKLEKFAPYKPTRVGKTGNGLANGIETSRDGRTVFVAEPQAGVVQRIALDGQSPTVSLELSFMPDNLHWGEDGHLYAGGPTFVDDSLKKACYAASICDTGFGVARIDPATFTAQVLLHTGDYGIKDKFGAAATALQVGKNLWLGTFHGDRIAILPLNTQAR